MPDTFAQLERGPNLSRPAELYQLTFGADNYYYTSQEQDIVFNGNTWRAQPIKRSQPTLNPRERKSNRVTLEGPADLIPFNEFLGIQPALRLELSIQRIQLDERSATDQSPEYPSPLPMPNPTTAFLLFEGYLNGVEFSSKNQTLKATFNPFNEQFTREIPRVKYTGLCNHVLYDSRCAVNKNLFSQVGTINGQDGNVYTISGFTGSAFTGGYIEVGTGVDYRTVLRHDGDQFTVLLPFASSVLGQQVTVYQGCDHSVTTCRDKFSNVANFGGFPYIPEVNPFEQSQFTKS